MKGLAAMSYESFNITNQPDIFNHEQMANQFMQSTLVNQPPCFAQASAQASIQQTPKQPCQPEVTDSVPENPFLQSFKKEEVDETASTTSEGPVVVGKKIEITQDSPNFVQP